MAVPSDQHGPYLLGLVDYRSLLQNNFRNFFFTRFADKFYIHFFQLLRFLADSQARVVNFNFGKSER